MRFKTHGVAPESAADLAFLLHGLRHLKEDGAMAIILPHGVVFRAVWKNASAASCSKCKKPDDVLFINASGRFVKGKRQNQLSEEDIGRIVGTYDACRTRENRDRDPLRRRNGITDFLKELGLSPLPWGGSAPIK